MEISNSSNGLSRVHCSNTFTDVRIILSVFIPEWDSKFWILLKDSYKSPILVFKTIIQNIQQKSGLIMLYSILSIIKSTIIYQ